MSKAEDIPTTMKIQWLNTTLKFIKDDQKLCYEYTEMPMSQAKYLYELMEKQDNDVGLGFKTLYSPVWEAMKIFGSKYKFEISLVESGNCNGKLMIRKVPISEATSSEAINTSLDQSVISDSSEDSDTEKSETKNNFKENKQNKANKCSKSEKYYKEKKKIIENISPSFLRLKLQTILNFISDETEASLIFRNLAPIEAKFLENFLGIYKRRHIFEELFSPACVDMFKKISRMLKSSEDTFKLEVCAAKTDIQSKKREVAILKVPSYSKASRKKRKIIHLNLKKETHLNNQQLSDDRKNIKTFNIPDISKVSNISLNEISKVSNNLQFTPKIDLHACASSLTNATLKVTSFDLQEEINQSQINSRHTTTTKLKTLRAPKESNLVLTPKMTKDIQSTVDDSKLSNVAQLRKPKVSDMALTTDRKVSVVTLTDTPKVRNVSMQDTNVSNVDLKNKSEAPNAFLKVISKVSNVTKDITRVSNMTKDIPKVSNITKDIPKVPNITKDIPKVSNVASEDKNIKKITHISMQDRETTLKLLNMDLENKFQEPDIPKVSNMTALNLSNQSKYPLQEISELSASKDKVSEVDYKDIFEKSLTETPSNSILSMKYQNFIQKILKEANLALNNTMDSHLPVTDSEISNRNLRKKDVNDAVKKNAQLDVSDQSIAKINPVNSKAVSKQKKINSDASTLNKTYRADYNSIISHPTMKRKKKTRLLFLKSVLNALEKDVISMVDYKISVQDKDRQFFDHAFVAFYNRVKLGLDDEESFLADKIVTYMKSSTRELTYKVSSVNDNIVYVYASQNKEDFEEKKQSILNDETKMAEKVSSTGKFDNIQNGDERKFDQVKEIKGKNLKNKVEGNFNENRICSKDFRQKTIVDMATPLESRKAERMMRLMGWEGGALGTRGEGLLEPIIPTIQGVDRTGLGHIKDTHLKLFNGILYLLKADVKSTVIEFTKLTKNDNMFISYIVWALNEREVIKLDDKEHMDLLDTIMTLMQKDSKVKIKSTICKNAVTINKLNVKQSKKKSASKIVSKNTNEMNAHKCGNEINQSNRKIKSSTENKSEVGQSNAKVKTKEKNSVQSDVKTKNPTAPSNVEKTKEGFSNILYQIISGQSKTKYEKWLYVKREILMKVLIFLESDLTRMDVRLPLMKKKIIKYLKRVCNNEAMVFETLEEKEISKEIQKRMVDSLQVEIHNREYFTLYKSPPDNEISKNESLKNSGSKALLENNTNYNNDALDMNVKDYKTTVNLNKSINVADNTKLNEIANEELIACEDKNDFVTTNLNNNKQTRIGLRDLSKYKINKDNDVCKSANKSDTQIKKMDDNLNGMKSLGLEIEKTKEDTNISDTLNIDVIKVKMHNIIKIFPHGYPNIKIDVDFAKNISSNMRNSICHGIQNGALIYSYKSYSLEDLLKKFNIVNFRLETIAEYKVNVRVSKIVSYDDFLVKFDVFNKDLDTKDWVKLGEVFTAEGLIFTIAINEESLYFLYYNNFVLYADEDTATFKILL